MASGYIKVSKIEHDIHDAGKRCGSGFLAALDRHVAEIVAKACAVHNGSRRTLDATVLDYITGRLR